MCNRSIGPILPGPLTRPLSQASSGPKIAEQVTLWGLRFRRPLLHDGSAATIEEAIARHREEADRSRQDAERLAEVDKARLLAFLKAL